MQKMKNKLRQEKGITMMALVVTIIILLILTSVLVFNTQDSVYIKRLNNLYSDIELLRAKTDEYYNEYGQIPAKIKYENKIQLEKLKNVRSTKNDTGDFYVIDLEAMEGITLNYGKDYENVKNLPKNEETNANNANTFQSKKIMIGDKTIDIPLIALISHHYLAMDNVQIKFKAKVGSVESQIPENNLLLSSPHRANLQMQMSNIKPNADDVMEVCVNFKVQETPESISRIIDDFVKNI